MYGKGGGGTSVWRTFRGQLKGKIPPERDAFQYGYKTGRNFRNDLLRYEKTTQKSIGWPNWTKVSKHYQTKQHKYTLLGKAPKLRQRG